MVHFSTFSFFIILPYMNMYYTLVWHLLNIATKLDDPIHKMYFQYKYLGENVKENMRYLIVVFELLRCGLQ